MFINQGPIEIDMTRDTKIIMKSGDADNHCIIDVLDANGNTLSRFGYYGTYWGVDGKAITIQN